MIYWSVLPLLIGWPHQLHLLVVKLQRFIMGTKVCEVWFILFLERAFRKVRCIAGKKLTLERNLRLRKWAKTSLFGQFYAFSIAVINRLMVKETRSNIGFMLKPLELRFKHAPIVTSCATWTETYCSEASSFSFGECQSRIRMSLDSLIKAAERDIHDILHREHKTAHLFFLRYKKLQHSVHLVNKTNCMTQIAQTCSCWASH